MPTVAGRSCFPIPFRNCLLALRLMAPERKLQVLFICTYASDEPYAAVVQAARAFVNHAQIYITGRLKPQDETLRQAAPPNVTFTGFVPEDRFIGLLHAATS